MTGDHVVKLLQIAGAAFGIPAAAAGTFAAYQSYFSTDVSCQKLRNDIVGIMERNVPPDTKRSLLKKEVTEEGSHRIRETLRRCRSRGARHFSSGDERTSCRRRPCCSIRAYGSAIAARPDRSTERFWRARLEGALRLGRDWSPPVRVVGGEFQRLRDLRHLIAASRHDFICENNAAGLVRAAGRGQRSKQAAEPATVRRLRTRAVDARRQRSIMGRSRSGLMLVSELRLP